MHVLISFLAGLSVGWVAQRYFQSPPPSDVAEQDGGTEQQVDKAAEQASEVTELPASPVVNAQRTPNMTPDAMHVLDDLSSIKGVGPKLAQALDELEIQTFAALADYPVDDLLMQLKAMGGRFTHTAIQSVVSAAAQAQAGKVTH
jgi:predicted flap endonuclease-1-like 5' DNA nuclease